MTRAQIILATRRALQMHSTWDLAMNWTAARPFLRFAKGVIATAEYSSRSTYTKDYNGWAIVAYLYGIPENQYGGNWCGMVTISNALFAAEISDNAQGRAPYVVYEYLGNAWYMCSRLQNRNYGGATRLNTEYPGLDASGWETVQNINSPLPYEYFARIMEAAKVRINVTGYGWTADQRFLVSNAGEVLATAENTPRSPYTKVNAGQALCAYFEDCNDGEWGSNWCGLLMISPDRNAAIMHCPSLGSNVGSLQEREYLGMPWYVTHLCQNAIWGGATHMDSPYPGFNFDGRPVFVINGRGCSDEAFDTVMQAAHIKIATAGVRPVLSVPRPGGSS